MADRAARKRSDSDNQSPAEILLQRVDGSFRSLDNANAYLAKVLSDSTNLGIRVWTLPDSAQTVAVNWWLVMMFLQCASAYARRLDAPTESALRFGEMLLKEANRWTEAAVSNGSLVDIDAPVPRTSVQGFPSLTVEASSCESIFSMFELVWLQVQTDADHIRQAGLPHRFDSVLRKLEVEMQPHVALFQLHRESWNNSFGVSDKIEALDRALPHIRELFLIGQKLWAPYLLGDEYRFARDKQPTLEDLELGFDPWTVTASTVRDRKKRDRRANRELMEFWSSNPNPRATLQLHQQLARAEAGNLIRPVEGRMLPYAPWPTMWVAVQPCSIAGAQFAPTDILVLYSGMNADDQFVNEIRRAGKLKVTEASQVRPAQQPPPPLSAILPAGVSTSRRPPQELLDELQLGFDPWAITDIYVQRVAKSDPGKISELLEFWKTNPNPGLTFQLQQQIAAASERGLIRLMDGRTLGYAPWPSIWVAWHPCTFGGVRFEGGELFALYSGMNADDQFVNEIRRTGTFKLKLG